MFILRDRRGSPAPEVITDNVDDEDQESQANFGRGYGFVA
jgi:hypothetical protein